MSLDSPTKPARKLRMRQVKRNTSTIHAMRPPSLTSYAKRIERLQALLVLPYTATPPPQKSAIPSSYHHRQSQRKDSGTHAMPYLMHDVCATDFLATYPPTNFSLLINCYGNKHLYKLRLSPTFYVPKLPPTNEVDHQKRLR